VLYQPTDFDWREAIPIRRRTCYPTDALIVSGGDAGRMAYLVLAGIVRFSLVTPDGREQVLAYLPPGSLFGEQAALGKTRLCDDLVAMADEPSEVAEVLATDVEAALRQHSDPFRELMRITSEKTSLFVQAAARSTFGSPGTRVAHVLAALGRRSDRLAMTQERLARLCGTTRVTVAAELRRLADEGAIEFNRSTIVIRDLCRLATSSRKQMRAAAHERMADLTP
jgi:CRP/FNR family cyclic AMP-dependent transcriptional regulator